MEKQIAAVLEIAQEVGRGGSFTVHDISVRCGLPVPHCSSYLRTLEECGCLEKSLLKYRTGRQGRPSNIWRLADL